MFATQHQLSTKYKLKTLCFLTNVHLVIVPKYMYASVCFTCQEDVNWNWRHLIIIVNSGALQFTDLWSDVTSTRAFHYSFFTKHQCICDKIFGPRVSAPLNLVQQ
jgi:hypothetical protein